MLKDLTNKNSTTGKKLIPYILILIILVGLFSPMGRVNAQSITYPGTSSGANPSLIDTSLSTPATNTNTVGGLYTGLASPQSGSTTTTTTGTTTPGAKDTNASSCLYWFGINPSVCLENFTLGFIQIWLFGVADLMLWLSAHFFNMLISISIGSVAIGLSGFVSGAWTVVRDLSNIFFILILLWVAIQTILGMGHETKKIIIHVIIMALLINFSLFFTKVVIDSSNILALVFYNKLAVSQTRPADSSGKDIGGEIYDKFSGIAKLTDGTLNLAEGSGQPATPFLIKLGELIVYGIISIWASYTFFVAGFLFLGRLVELWVLMIFSPFAFMSWSMPELFKDVEYISWNEWSKKLIATSFMAPIFMFFLFLIFQLMNSGVFDSFTKSNGGAIATLLGVLIPAAMIIMLLKKAVEFAKKGGGAVGEKFAKGIEMVGGLATTAAIGAASGGAALALRAGVTAGTGKLATMAATAKPGSMLGRNADRLKDFDSFARKRSFDMRAAPEGMKSLMSKGNIFAVQEGGLEGIKERQIEKRKKRADELEKRGTKDHKVKIEEAEIALKEATLPVKLKLANVNETIEKAKGELNDAKNGGDAQEIQNAKNKLDNAKNEKAKIRGAEYTEKDPNTGVVIKYKKVAGGIADLEEKAKEAKQNLEVGARDIRENFATGLENMSKGMKVFHTIRKFGALGAPHSVSADKEAARKVRMGENYSGGGEKSHAPAPKDISYTPKPSTPPSSGSGGAAPHK